MATLDKLETGQGITWDREWRARKAEAHRQLTLTRSSLHAFAATKAP